MNSGTSLSNLLSRAVLYSTMLSCIISYSGYKLCCSQQNHQYNPFLTPLLASLSPVDTEKSPRIVTVWIAFT